MSSNDNFADRRDLGSGTTANDSGANFGFTSEEGEPSQSYEIQSAWWSWTPAQSGWVVIDTEGSDFYAYLSVFIGNAVDSLTLVAQNSDRYSSSQISRVGFWAETGTEYQIAVDGSSSQTGEIQLNLEQDLSFIPNDNFADRRDLGSSTIANDSGSNIGFTSESGEPSQVDVIKSAWWSWTPTETGWVEINTFESDFDTYLSVFTGNAVDSLTLVAQNDDSPYNFPYDNQSPRPYNYQSLVRFWAEVGTEYQIAVDGYYDDDTGNIQLNLEQDLSFIPNDNFADRRDLGSGTTANDSVNNVGFTLESGEPSQSQGNNSAWWSWTPAQSGWVEIDTYNSDIRGYPLVFTGNAVDSLTLVVKPYKFAYDGWDDIYFFEGYVDFWAEAGIQYQISIDGWSNQVGNIELNLEQTIAISLIWQKDNTDNFIMSYLDKTRRIVTEEDFLLNRQNKPASLNNNWNVYQANLIGADETDLLLQNKISGKFQIWELEGNKIVGNHYVTNASTNKQPQINDNWDVLTGNFTGTPQDDILLKNKVVGTFSLWEMEDNFIVGTHTITRNGKAVQLNNNHNWDLIVGNFVGSEHDDILLRNKTSGNLQVWEIHDKEIIASHEVINPLSNRQISLNQNWQIFSTKFGSGVQDYILLQNKISGGLQVWDMDGNQLAGITHLTDPNYSDSSLVI